MRAISIALLAALAACSNHPATSGTAPPSGGRPARLDLARAIAAHPLTPMLREYDADLATLRVARNARGLTGISARVAADLTDSNDVLAAAARQTEALPVRAPQIPSTGTPQDRGAAAVATYRDALQQRNERALVLRSSQLQESEANAAYEFDRAHAGTRLQLRVRLRNLHLEPHERQRMRSQLDALQAQEHSLVAELRRQNDATLTDFARALQREGNANLTELVGDVDAHRRAANQLRDGVRTPDPALGRDDRAAALQAYRGSGADIALRLNDVATQDRSASAHAATAVSDLQRARSALRAEIVASIETTARSIAGERGLGRLYESHAPEDASDITAEVVRRVESAMR